MTTTALKSYARTAYSLAAASPATADWRAVADALHAALCPRPAGEPGAPRWWADWKLGKVYSLDSLAVRFADGVTVRCNIAKAPGKLPRIAAACRVAIGFYRAQTRSRAVPAFAYLEDLSAGVLFDAETCTRLTTDLRSADHGEAAAQAGVTLARLDWMAAEVERRRAGLAVALADHAELMADPERAALPLVRGSVTTTLAADSEARVAMWRNAADAGADELARMREAYGIDGEAAGEAVLADDTAGEATLIPAATIVSPDLNVVADLPPVVEVGAPEPAPTRYALWLQTLLAEVAVGAAIADGADPAELARLTAVADALHDAHAAAVASEPARPSPTASEAPTVLAVCTSHAARRALLSRLPGACALAWDGPRSKGGNYRITLADAERLGSVRGVRFTGLPRKPRQPALAAL